MLEWLAEALGADKSTTLGGIIGAILSLVFMEGETSWRVKAFAIFGGWAAANYLTPALALYFGLQRGQVNAGLAFILGLFGMLVARSIVVALRNLDLAKIITRRFGGGE